MASIQDPFQNPLQAQLKFISTFTSKAFEGVEKLVALNFSTTRASIASTSATLRQLALAREPADVLAIGQQSAPDMDKLFAYGRELINIATDTRAALLEAATSAPRMALPEPFAAPQKRTAAPQAPAAAPDGQPQVMPPVKPIEAKPAGEAAPAAKPIAAAVAELAGEAEGKHAPFPSPAVKAAPAKDSAKPKGGPAPKSGKGK